MIKNQEEKSKIFDFSLIRRPLFLTLSLVLPVILIPSKPAAFLHNFQMNFKDKNKNNPPPFHKIHKDDKQTQQSSKIKVGYPVPLDYFLINLPQKKEQKFFKVEVELNVDNPEIRAEINKRILQVRDIIIILVSSKKYEQIATLEGQESLKKEIQKTINSFLTKGKINRVLFKEFIET